MGTDNRTDDGAGTHALVSQSDETAKKDEFYCRRCDKIHRDGDEIEVIRSSVAIGVKCMVHAVWARRHEIMRLHESWKLAPKMVKAFERVKKEMKRP